MDREEKSFRAAEYVLGLLSREEILSFEDQLARDPELRAEVEIWQAHFAVLFDETETRPPHEVAQRLRNELFNEDLEEDGPGARMPDWLTAALVVKAVALLSVVLWLLLSL